MANILNKLPIEIRNQIYEDLLLYRDGFITLNFDGDSIDRSDGDNVGLHTAILRTCKQLYAEGSDVLYGHSRFRYCPNVLMSHEYKGDRPTTSAIKKIRHVSYFSFPLWLHNTHIDYCIQLEVACREPKPLWYIPIDGGSFVIDLATILKFLNVLGCSLTTLNMKFVFHNGQFDNDSSSRWQRDSRFNMWGRREAIKEAFRGIQVANAIAINLDCFNEELGAMLEDFANGSKLKELWNVKSCLAKTTIRLDKRRDELWDNFSPPGCKIPGLSYDWDSIRYTWSWTFTPTDMVRAKRRPKTSIEEESSSSEEKMDRKNMASYISGMTSQQLF